MRASASGSGPLLHAGSSHAHLDEIAHELSDLLISPASQSDLAQINVPEGPVPIKRPAVPDWDCSSRERVAGEEVRNAG